MSNLVEHKLIVILKEIIKEINDLKREVQSNLNKYDENFEYLQDAINQVDMRLDNISQNIQSI